MGIAQLDISLLDSHDDEQGLRSWTEVLIRRSSLRCLRYQDVLLHESRHHSGQAMSILQTALVLNPFKIPEKMKGSLSLFLSLKLNSQSNLIPEVVPGGSKRCCLQIKAEDSWCVPIRRPSYLCVQAHNIRSTYPVTYQGLVRPRYSCQSFYLNM